MRHMPFFVVDARARSDAPVIPAGEIPMQTARLNFRVAFIAQLVALAALLSVSAMPSAHAQVCPFDDGNSSLAVDGLILTRYALGITGAPLVAGTDINAVDAVTVEGHINCPSCGLNITGNPTMTVTDATIISRKLAGFSGAALTDGLNLGSGTRNTPASVNSFLLAGCGATGGTVSSITAGTGLTGGVITASGIIAADTAYLQRRVSSSCSTGSFITAIAADGSITCSTPSTGASGTVTNIATGTGLTGGPISTTGTITADTTYLQRRVTSSCSAGSFITAIAADGTATCGTPPRRYERHGHQHRYRPGARRRPDQHDRHDQSGRDATAAHRCLRQRSDPQMERLGVALCQRCDHRQRLDTGRQRVWRAGGDWNYGCAAADGEEWRRGRELAYLW